MPEGSEIKWLRVSVARTRNFMYFQQNENGIFIKTCALLKIYKRFLLTPYSFSLSLGTAFSVFSAAAAYKGDFLNRFFSFFTFLLQPYRSCDSCAFQLSNFLLFFFIIRVELKGFL